MSDPIDALDALLKLADVARTQRASQRPVLNLALVNGQWQGQVEGSGDRVYFVHIRVVGQRAFGCTCPDHQRQLRGAMRPCKHVISLALLAWKQTVREAFEEFEEEE
jgi:uncharacterized Zn finger protein